MSSGVWGILACVMGRFNALSARGGGFASQGLSLGVGLFKTWPGSSFILSPNNGDKFALFLYKGAKGKQRRAAR